MAIDMRELAARELTGERTAEGEQREMLMPTDLAKALAAEPTARRAYDEQPADGKRWIILAVESARTQVVRRRRIATAVAALIRSAE